MAKEPKWKNPHHHWTLFFFNTTVALSIKHSPEPYSCRPGVGFTYLLPCGFYAMQAIGFRMSNLMLGMLTWIHMVLHKLFDLYVFSCYCIGLSWGCLYRELGNAWLSVGRNLKEGRMLRFDYVWLLSFVSCCNDVVFTMSLEFGYSIVLVVQLRREFRQEIQGTKEE